MATAHWGRISIIVLATTISGCENVRVSSSDVHRLLTGSEMDQVSAGSAVAIGSADASAVGGTPQTTASVATLVSPGQPVSSEPFMNAFTVNYASAHATASAGNASLNQAEASAQIAIEGSGGAVSISSIGSATAAGGASGQSDADIQLYGMSIGPVDVGFGTTTATACCAPTLSAQAITAGTAGAYSRRLQASQTSNARAQSRSRTDISIVSSALPILDAGQVSALVAPTLSQSTHP